MKFGLARIRADFVQSFHSPSLELFFELRLSRSLRPKLSKRFLERKRVPGFAKPSIRWNSKCDSNTKI